MLSEGWERGNNGVRAWKGNLNGQCVSPRLVMGGC